MAAESEKRTKIPNLSDCFTKEDVRRETQAIIGEHDQLLTLVKEIARLKVFVLSKDNSAGQSERKIEEGKDRRRGRQKNRWEDNVKEWTGMDFASSTRPTEDRTRWKMIVIVICGAPTSSQGYGIDDEELLPL